MRACIRTGPSVLNSASCSGCHPRMRIKRVAFAAAGLEQRRQPAENTPLLERFGIHADPGIRVQAQQPLRGIRRRRGHCRAKPGSVMHGHSRLQARPAALGIIVQAHRPLRIPLPRLSVLARMRQARACQDARTPLIDAGIDPAELSPSRFATASGARTWPHSRRRAASASNQLPNGLERRSIPAPRIPRATAGLHCPKIGRQSLFCAIIGQMRLIRL